MFGINVIGHITGNLGLGVLARAVVKLLLHNAIPVAAYDLDPGLGRGGTDLSLRDALVSSAADLPHPVNLFVLPAPSLHHWVPQMPEVALAPQRMNVALPMWELPTMPPQWHTVLEFFDVLVAGSPFIRALHENHLSGVFTIPAELPLFLPEPAVVTRDDVLPEAAGRVLFLTAFEPYSDPSRKNPCGTIRAFLDIVDDFPNTHLVVKVNNAADDWEADPALASLMEAGRSAGSVSFLPGAYTYEEALGLYAMADVVVSLHRAEGIGFLPMEAMALGKPVIATGWSGNMAYMHHGAACLVDYRIVPVHGPGGIYERMLAGTPASWAEPNLATAAAWMRRLAANPELRERYGLAARAQIARYQARASSAAFVAELREIYANRDLLCKTAAQKTASLGVLAELSLVPPPPPEPTSRQRLLLRASSLLRRLSGITA